MMSSARCPRCGQQLSNGECLCGYRRRSRIEMRKIVQANLSQILTDVVEIGPGKTSKKWRIGNSTLYRIPEVRRVMLLKDGDNGSHDGLPPLPAFSESWAPEVQLKWLEIWEKVEVRQN